MIKLSLKRFWWTIPLFVVIDICAYIFILWCNLNIGPVIEPGGEFDQKLMEFWIWFCAIYIPIKVLVAFPALALVWAWKNGKEDK